MTRLLTILTLLTICLDSIGQKKNKLTINYTYFIISSVGDTVRCKRTPQAELTKLQSIKGVDREIGLRLATRIFNLESILDKKKKGQEGYEMLLDENIKDLNTILEESRIELDLTDYENEFAFYQRRQKERSVKLEQARQRKQKAYDSLNVANKRQKQMSDSTKEANYRMEQERLDQESIVEQKKLEEQEKKEQEEYEKAEEARKKLLIQKYGQQNGELIFNKKIKVGWTKDMCRESWGKPRQVNRTITATVIREQWVYSIKRYLYFDNDILTTIQD